MSENHFLEVNYIKELLDTGYREIDKVHLPDGVYMKYGGGYYFSIHTSEEKLGAGRYIYDTGFNVVTESGIRGTYDGNELIIRDGVPVGVDVYKILTNNKKIIREHKLEDLL